MIDLPTALSVALLAALLALPVLLLPRLEGWTQTSQSSLVRWFRARRHPPSEVVALRVYPIKSCRGFEVPRTKLRMHGLDLDRRWMFVDASTNVFLTIRQIPEMTLINTALSDDGEDLVLSISGLEDKGSVSIPARPDAAWLEAHTSLAQVKIWDTETDAHVYGPEINDMFSAFLGRAVTLVYKGPTPRILQGNGDPRLLGRSQSTNFPDVHPVLIASEASIGELNARLQTAGADAITVERFRPNIIIRGNAPWTEDSWKLVRIGSPGGAPLTLDIVARCARCQVPNVDPDTAEKHKTQPWNTLMSYRRVDEGITYKPCFGMLSAPRNEGEIEVGMRFEVVEETSSHRYIKGF